MNFSRQVTKTQTKKCGRTNESSLSTFQKFRERKTFDTDITRTIGCRQLQHRKIQFLKYFNYKLLENKWKHCFMDKLQWCPNTVNYRINRITGFLFNNPRRLMPQSWLSDSAV